MTSPRGLLRRIDRWCRLVWRLVGEGPQVWNYQRPYLLQELRTLTERIVPGLLALEIDPAPFARLEHLVPRHGLSLIGAAQAAITVAMREVLDARDRVVQMAGEDSPRRKALDARDRLALALREEREAQEAQEAQEALSDCRDAPVETTTELASDAGEELGDLVTLRDIAAICKVDKRTARGWHDAGVLPEPAIPSPARGKPHRWRWGEVRPALAEHTALPLPEQFPDRYRTR